jgi:hypothetical protein
VSGTYLHTRRRSVTCGWGTVVRSGSCGGAMGRASYALLIGLTVTLDLALRAETWCGICVLLVIYSSISARIDMYLVGLPAHEAARDLCSVSFRRLDRLRA